MRRSSARLLSAILRRAEEPFPTIGDVAFNALTAVLFNPKSTLSAHYGAVLGLEAVGMKAVERILPHLGFYVSCIGKELNSDDVRQASQACSVLELLTDVLRKASGTERVRDQCERVIAVITRTNYA